MIRRIYLLLSLLILGAPVFSQGYRIELSAPEFAGTDVILAEYFTSRMIPKDTASVSLLGEAVFEGDEPFDGGLYIIYFNSKYYFDLMLDSDQEFRILTDSSDLANLTRFEGSADNTLFYSYKKYLSDKRLVQESYMEELASAVNAKDSVKVNEKITVLQEEINAHIEEMIETNRGSFFSTFLLAMKEPEVPEELAVGTQRQQDSIKYVFYKDHYFDNFDPGDIRLLHTPLYEPKVKTFINRVAPQHPDSLIVYVDMLLERSRANEEIFRYMLITLFNNYAESKLMGMDKVYFHIAEKYYIPEATWSDPKFLENLKDNLEKSKPTFIGNIAPDIAFRGIPESHFHMAEMDTVIKQDPHVGYDLTLHGQDAEYTVLYFWESDCGHCQKSTPKLYKVFEKYRDQSVKFLSVHVINSVEGKVEWIDFINEHQLYGWTNCWSPYSNDFRLDYNLQSFPQLFLLDKEKRIVAKTLTPEQVDDLLGRFLNRGNPE